MAMEGDRADPPIKPLVLPEKFSGREEWNQWISHFENVAAVNMWDEAQKLLWMKVRLTERAQTAFQHFPDAIQRDYTATKGAMKERFEPESRRDRYQAEFQIRRKKKTEGWADFSEDLKILVDKAYPQLEEAAREQIALSHYISQIDNMQVAFSVKQRKPTTLDDAVSATLEMESYLGPKFDVAEVFTQSREREETVASVAPDTTLTMMKQLLERMEKMEMKLSTMEEGKTFQSPQRRNQKESRPRGKRAATCWNCGRRGHISQDCWYQGNDQPSVD